MTDWTTFALAIAASPGGWLPPQASTAAPGVDFVFALIFWICAFFFTLIAVLTVTFVLRYRQRAWRQHPEPSPSHSTRLEVLWSVIPTLLIVMIFAASTRSWWKLTKPPDELPQVWVTAKKWAWWFEHPDGTAADELHVVVNHPVELIMSADDVLHSLYVPAFRLKQDIVPGRYTKAWFQATQPGTYPLYCAEYCGTNHSQMLSSVVVHENQASYDAWKRELAAIGDLPPVELGRWVYERRACKACHSLDGKNGTGPTFLGLWGSTSTLVDGSDVKVDEAHIRESILQPRIKVRAGYQPIMPVTNISERQIKGIIALIKSLGSQADDSESPAPPKGVTP